MSIISVIGVVILLFLLYSVVVIVKDEIERYATKRQENKIWKQYWKKVDYYRNLITAHFCEGLAPVKINSKYGYINDNYDVVIQPQFDKAYSFYDGMAIVTKGNKEAVIDKTGKVIFITFGKIRYSEGVAVVSSGTKFGYIDINAEYVILPKYDGAMDFNEGVAAVKLGEKWGFINKRGEIIINPQYDDAMNFHDGYAAVKLGNKWGYINKVGQIVIGFNYDGYGVFEDGYVRCYNMINKKINK